jgi:hypothetical protein
MAGFRISVVETNSIANRFPEPERFLASLIQIQNSGQSAALQLVYYFTTS